MIRIMKVRWRREQFDPSWLGILVNPFYIARRGLCRTLKEFFPELHGEVLDVGCGRKPYRSLITANCYVGVDLDTSTTRALGVADYFYDGRKLPFSDAAFDGVLCSQVLEHVFSPDEFLQEIARVLRPNGCLVLTVPFTWDEHEQPVDFARYTSFGLRALLERCGFTVVRQRKSVTDARAITQLGAGWVFKVTRSKSRILNLVVQVVLIAPFNMLGIIVGLVLPRNEDFYLDNVLLARKKTVNDDVYSPRQSTAA